MPELVWDAVTQRTYETGIDRAVLYLPNSTGVPWNGLTAVSDTPDGGAVSSYYLDGIKYLDTVGGEDYKASLEAFTYPDEFEICQGTVEVQSGLFATAQPHKTFGLAYRTKIGSDTDGIDHGYKIHLVYNATVAPLSKSHKTLSSTTELSAFQWDISAVPVAVPGVKPTAHLIIDSRHTDPETLASIEQILYGDDQLDSHLPTIENLLNMIITDGDIIITDNGDGTWTAIGPNEYFTMLDDKTFQITEANAVYLDDDTYTISDST